MITFQESNRDGFLRYDLTGRLDSAGVEQIEGALTERLRQASQNVLIDLGKVPFVGSLGIRMLIASARTLQRGGHNLVLVGVQPQVLDVFETVALSDLIPIAANTEEAVRKLGG